METNRDKIHVIQDALYYCHPKAASIEKAQGVLIGLMCGLMAGGETFTSAIRLFHVALSTIPVDLDTKMVLDRLPKAWAEEFKKNSCHV